MKPHTNSTSCLFAKDNICAFGKHTQLEAKIFLLTTSSEARWGYTKSIQVLVFHFSFQNDHNNHLAIIKLIHFRDAPDQK